ncbi:alpha/beta fold hydrolase [uncultured Flavobacterium sp.]|jgi:esterase/lipase|uniref:alpha/beta fold hydrolase n=1 Tax=uncultured Flavobacterium sp. TaxID=165435 RepID=UPI002596DBC5|nr:alpha/beta fold hydrolase [uncultured Flavobacterium sp.]
MNTYVLIHGAWHGAWCWTKIISLLEEQGHKVITPNLPGHGHDETPTENVTLQSYTDVICEILDSLDESVILVGHSMGGLVISQVAEYRPLKIKQLIYIAAYVLKNEGTILSNLIKDSESMLIKNIDFKTERTEVRIIQDEIKEIFYGDCSDLDITFAKSFITNQSIGPIKTRLVLNEEKFNQIPKKYIECLNDNAISINMQRKMYSEFSFDVIHSLNSSHSPFFSSPIELVSLIIN